MSSPLLIAYPDIPYYSIAITPAEAYSDFRPVYNLFRGYRCHHGELETASNTSRLIHFNLGTSGAKTASYLILGRADLLEDQGVTDVTLELSGDNITWFSAGTSSIASNLMTGPKNQDLVLTFTTTSLAQYWRVYFAGSTVSKLRFSKVYFGNMFDMGVPPDDFSYQIAEDSYSEFYADSGAIHPEQFREPQRSIVVTWVGVTDAKCDELMGSGNVIKSNSKGLFLYSPSQPQILNSDGLLHVEMTSCLKEDRDSYPDWNTVTMTFKELLG